MVARSSRRISVIAAVVAVIVLAGACGGKKSPVAVTSSTPTTSAAATTPAPTAPATTAPAVAALNPLTGVGKVPNGPVIAVKIDDTENGRPSVGIDKADVIYIEQAEGGLTRLVTVFATNKPTVEAVRSVRASDPELLSQYGKITLVASGGGGDSLRTLDASILHSDINDRGGPDFSRDDNRPAPYNLQMNLKALSARIKSATAKNIGFTFAATDPRLATAKAAPKISTKVGSTPITFTWDSSAKVYVRTIDGVSLRTADGSRFAAPNVLVQLCRVTTNYGDVDVEGNPSQYTHSIGSGRAVLFRNGVRIEGKWSRASATSPTVFTDLAGKTLLQSPGNTIVVLGTTGTAV